MTRLIGVASGTTAYWTGQGKAKPVSKMVLSADTLSPLKVAALTVVTQELVASSDPRAESWIRADLVRAMSEVMDATFLDPSGPAVADVSPASILDGGTAVAGSATMTSDIQNLLEHFSGDLTQAFFVMSAYAGSQVGSNAAFPNAGARGGEIAGVPMITSDNVPDGIVALIDASGIAIAEGDMALKTSTHGTVEMDNAPAHDSTTPTAASLVSLWQANSIALLSEKTINWKVMRAGSVAYLENSSWATPSTTT